jgi:hypothetical protein
MHCKLSILAGLGLAMAASGCGGNAGPSAEAGADQQVEAGTTVTLDGSKSRDDDGRVEYMWEWLTTPPGETQPVLSSPTSARPSFTPEEEGTYTLKLTVRDSDGLRDEDQVSVHVVGGKVRADCGKASRRVDVDEEVTLSGERSRAEEGDDLQYKWTLEKPSGSEAEIEEDDQEEVTFTPDKSGTYRVKLTVRAGGAQGTATCTVQVGGSGGDDGDSGGDDGDSGNSDSEDEEYGGDEDEDEE